MKNFKRIKEFFLFGVCGKLRWLYLRYRKIKEIKRFCPSSLFLPNGSHYQKGGFIHECEKNAQRFILDKVVFKNTEHSHGIIVFPANFDDISSYVDLFDSKCCEAVDKYNSARPWLYKFGHFFYGKYAIGKDDFNFNSVCLAVSGFYNEPYISGVLKFAYQISNAVGNIRILVKDLDNNKIYQING